MRNPLLIALLGATAISISACSSTGSLTAGGVSSASGGGSIANPGNGSSTDSSDSNTETTTGGNEVVLTENGIITNGDAAYTFSSADVSTGSPKSQTRITINDEGTGAETVNVQVDPKNEDIEFPAAVKLGLYGADTATKNSTYADTPSDPLKAYVNDLGPTSKYRQDIYSHDSDGRYREYRKIIPDVVDAELQLWNYTNSYVGQYRNWGAVDGSDSNSLVVFYGGDKTDPQALSAMPTASYTGRAGATATASSFLPFTRTKPDNFAAVPANTFPGASGTPMNVNPNGEWRMQGDAYLTADFANGQVLGQINNLYWRKFQPDDKNGTSDYDGYITIDPLETASPFPRQYNLRAAIDAETGDYTGSVTSKGWVVGNNGVKGSFFGANAGETAGVFHAETTAPQPTDTLSPYEENRRGFLNVRGVFQGNKN